MRHGQGTGQVKLIFPTVEAHVDSLEENMDADLRPPRISIREIMSPVRAMVICNLEVMSRANRKIYSLKIIAGILESGGNRYVWRQAMGGLVSL